MYPIIKEFAKAFLVWSFVTTLVVAVVLSVVSALAADLG